MLLSILYSVFRIPHIFNRKLCRILRSTNTSFQFGGQVPLLPPSPGFTRIRLPQTLNPCSRSTLWYPSETKNEPTYAFMRHYWFWVGVSSYTYLYQLIITPITSSNTSTNNFTNSVLCNLKYGRGCEGHRSCINPELPCLYANSIPINAHQYLFVFHPSLTIPNYSLPVTRSRIKRTPCIYGIFSNNIQWLFGNLDWSIH